MIKVTLSVDLTFYPDAEDEIQAVTEAVDRLEGMLDAHPTVDWQITSEIVEWS